MKFKNLFLILTCLILVNCKSNTKPEQELKEEDSKLTVYYFHNTQRCMTCNAIEAKMKETIDNYFSKEVNDKVINVKILNREEDINSSIVEKYEIWGSSLILVYKKDGNENVEVYEGAEAEKFLEKESKGSKKLMFISEGNDMTTVAVDSDDLHWISEGAHKEVMKKVNVEVEDGVTKLTITTTEDGKEKVEVFEGEEAEAYIEKMDHGKKMKIHISEDGDKKVMKEKIIIIEEKDDDQNDED